MAIRLFIDIFSDEFVKNILICLTRFRNDPRSIEERKVNGSSKDKIINSLKKEFLSRFGKPLSTNQFAFVDNGAFLMRKVTPAEEIKIFEE